MSRPPHAQARLDSAMEAVTNTAIGFVVSLITWAILARAYGIPMPWSTNLQITGIFTVVSILRQYVLRRAFDGRSPWTALKGVFERSPDSQGRPLFTSFAMLPGCFGFGPSGPAEKAEFGCDDCQFASSCARVPSYRNPKL